MRFNQSYSRRYLLLLAVLLCAFALFALFVSRYLVEDKAYLEVFFRACIFFGIPLVAYALIKIFAEDKDGESPKAQHNICLFLASATIVVSGISVIYIYYK